ncbi:hypothetical protein [Spirosoma jeollabukense]
MYTIFLHHIAYLDQEPQITMPFLPLLNDWLEIPVDIRNKYWPGCTEILFVVEREHLFDGDMTFYGTRLHLQDWEGN